MPRAGLVLVGLFGGLFAGMWLGHTLALGVVGLGLGTIAAFLGQKGAFNFDDNDNIFEQDTVDSYHHQVSKMINDFVEGELTFDIPGLEEIYKPKGGESIVWAGRANMVTVRERTSAVSYAGPRMRFRIMKGVYYTAGKTSLKRHKESYHHMEGAGVLVITTKRIQFINQASGGNNWMKTWRGLTNWKPYADAVEVAPNTGKAKLFFLPGAGETPGQDPELACVVMSEVCDGETPQEAREES